MTELKLTSCRAIMYNKTLAKWLHVNIRAVSTIPQPSVTVVPSTSSLTMHCSRTPCIWGWGGEEEEEGKSKRETTCNQVNIIILFTCFPLLNIVTTNSLLWAWANTWYNNSYRVFNKSYNKHTHTDTDSQTPVLSYAHSQTFIRSFPVSYLRVRESPWEWETGPVLLQFPSITGCVGTTNDRH